MLINMLDFLIQIFKEREEDLRRLSRPLECSCFRTSIWDETLYKVCIFPKFPHFKSMKKTRRTLTKLKDFKLFCSHLDLLY
jgi:hypothetical protein